MSVRGREVFSSIFISFPSAKIRSQYFSLLMVSVVFKKGSTGGAYCWRYSGK